MYAFPRRAWEREGLKAAAAVSHRVSARSAEVCVPTQSVGTRRPEGRGYLPRPQPVLRSGYFFVSFFASFSAACSAAVQGGTTLFILAYAID